MTTKFDIGQNVWFLNGAKKPTQREVMEIRINHNGNLYYKLKDYEFETYTESDLAATEYELFEHTFFEKS